MSYAVVAGEPVWMRSARCGKAEVEGVEVLTMPERDRKLAAVEQGRAICQACNVRVECLNYALKTCQTENMWGGFTEHELRLMRLNHFTGTQAIELCPSGPFLPVLMGLKNAAEPNPVTIVPLAS